MTFPGEAPPGHPRPGDLLDLAGDRERALVEFLPVPFLLLNRAGIVRAVNPALCQMLGGEPFRYLGSPLAGRVAAHHRRSFRQHLLHCRDDSQTAVSTELQLLGPANALLNVRLVSQRAVHDHEAYWTVIIDVSDRSNLQTQQDALKEFQQQARRAAEAREMFVAVLGHELRSPLAAISAAAATLQSAAPGDLDIPHLAALIARSVAAQARLIDDLFDLTHLNRHSLELQHQEVDLHGVVEDAVETFASDLAAKELAVELDLQANPHAVRGDPVRLRQVFWNLVKNAIKFTPTGGRLGMRSWNRGGNVVLEVSDNGAGIAPEMLARIFGRFEQASRGAGGGVGLGLAIAKGIVELHGGQITAASPGPGKGSRFLVELPTLSVVAHSPLPEPVTLRPQPAARPPQRSGRAARVLLVEDNADLAEAMGLALQTFGYQVQTAATFKAAMNADLDQFDVLLSDIDLPDGNGRDLLRLLRQRRAIPAIALSGYTAPAEVSASEAAGFLLHLQKPIDLPRLQAALRQVLEGPGLSPAGRRPPPSNPP